VKGPHATVENLRRSFALDNKQAEFIEVHENYAAVKHMILGTATSTLHFSSIRLLDDIIYFTTFLARLGFLPASQTVVGKTVCLILALNV
jgi:hypothetical protein